MKKLNTSPNPEMATGKLLQSHNVKVCTSTIKDTLQNHPDYPSILSISDSLKQWKVNNVAIKAAEENLQELPTPFIAHLKNDGGSFTCVNEVSNGSITYFSGGG